MTAPVLSPPVATGQTPVASSGHGRWLVLLLVGALVAGAGIGLLASSVAGPPARVVPSFTPGTAEASAWGNQEVYGAPGSWVLLYGDGTSTTMRLPWDGGAVASARLGEGPVDLATVVAARAEDGELVTTVAFDGCDYFHEREVQVYESLTVTPAAGGDVELLFDKPLVVHAPMLWQCPDRLVDRQAKLRSEL